MTELTFPPAMTGEAVDGDPFETAVMRAVTGCDAGLVTYRVRVDTLAAALVLAPEVPLRQAAAMLPLAAVGFQNALGALAPPEVAVHLEWQGGMYQRGVLRPVSRRCGDGRSRCGARLAGRWLRAAAPARR